MPETSPQLDGLVAVVTGGAGHLGREMTATLALQGAKVVMADLDGQRAEDGVSELLRDGLDVLALQLDVASEESVATAFGTIADHYGGVDVLVNNAGPTTFVSGDAPVLDLPLAAWEGTLKVVLSGALICCRHAIPMMVERGGGSIINIASIHAHAGDADMTAYPVAKAGILGLTRAVATQYGRLGVRCNSVSFGTIPPPQMSAEFRQQRVRHQLIPREGRATDAANVVAFLASPASSFLTGTDLVADGGALAHLPSYADGGTRGLLNRSISNR